MPELLSETKPIRTIPVDNNPVYRELSHQLRIAGSNAVCHAHLAQSAKNNIDNILFNYMPSGSGVDSPVRFSYDRSNENRLVFNLNFHHMNEYGYYTRWTNHGVIVTPTFDGIKVRITGSNYNGIKEYLVDLFHEALTASCTHYPIRKESRAS